MESKWTVPKRHIYTVSELTENIKEFLEETFPFVWVTGEIANLRQPVSGHLYFTLKDASAQISAVIFRAHSRSLRFDLEDGMAVTAMGRINVYESRGIYQVIVEYVEPGGLGALQAAFEQLKAKLSSEGLFDEKRKRPIPFLCQKIAVITSPTGAVIQDFLHVAQRRFPNVEIEIAPAMVQGEGAAQEIVRAFELIGKRGRADVIVLARGGGSLEDLQAFNSEAVARAIFLCEIPVVSAVGHETDYTIADFTADLRAPTPSAGAELIVPEKAALLSRAEGLEKALSYAMTRQIRSLGEQVGHVCKRLIHPSRKIVDHRLRIDDLLARAQRACTGMLRHTRDRVEIVGESLERHGPRATLKTLRNLLEHLQQRHEFAITKFVQSKRTALRFAAGKISALNPLAVLERGFSVTRILPELVIVKDVEQVRVGEKVAVRVAKGEMVCRVERK
jgi:exodeoxyribonuclease VII large subunit